MKINIYRKKLATTALIAIMEFIVEALDEREEIMLTCLDLNWVNNKVLLEKVGVLWYKRTHVGFIEFVSKKQI